MAKKPDLGRNGVAQNRKARHNYFIEEVFEAGLALTGTEVKSLRGGRSSIGECYVTDQGGDGCISEAANVPPRQCGDMHDAWKKSAAGKVLEIQDRLMPLHKALFIDTSPAPVKYACELIGQASAQLRLPLVECTEPTKKQVRDAMVHAGLIN